MVRLQNALGWLCLLFLAIVPRHPRTGVDENRPEYAYALSFSSNVVTGYQIGAEGNLSPLQKDGLAIHGEASDIATVLGNRAVFIVNKTHNQIGQFHIGPDGLLSPSAEASIPTGNNPLGISLDPSGQFAYVLNDSGISQYRVMKNGMLSALSPAIVVSDQKPRNIQFVPNKPYAYCLNFDGSISQFHIEATGNLTPLTPSTVAPDVKRLVVIKIDPTGQFVYLLSPRQNAVVQYQIAADGTLKPSSPGSLVLNATPVAMDFSPSGQIAYIAAIDRSLLLQYKVSADGHLQPAPNTIAPGASPTQIFVNADRKAVYVVNREGNSISQYRIKPEGTLAALSAPVAAGSNPQTLSVDPTGRFAYVVDGDSNSAKSALIWQYQVDALGRLEPLMPRAVATPPGAYFLTIAPPFAP